MFICLQLLNNLGLNLFENFIMIIIFTFYENSYPTFIFLFIFIIMIFQNILLIFLVILNRSLKEVKEFGLKIAPNIFQFFTQSL
jgi:hypothetical protein